MVSEVSLSNLAMAAIGHRAFIQDLDEPSVEARYSKLFYSPALKMLLRAHPWNFATSRAALSALTTPVEPWTYIYALPTKCLKARYVVPSYNSEKIPFEVALSADGESRVLHTNQQNAVLVFTSNVTNPDLFDPMFVECFHLLLAAKLAPTIAPTKSQEALTRFLNAMRQAVNTDAGEGEPDLVEVTDWLEARITGSLNPYFDNRNLL